MAESKLNFDNYSETYKKHVENSVKFSGLPLDFFAAAKAKILSETASTHFSDKDNLSLLDVGCGVGVIHSLLKPIFRNISGVDISAASIEHARMENPDLDYRTYNGTKLPYPQGAFDVATTICVMHHVPPAEWQAFMQEMKRVVRPGGLVCVIEHNPFNPLTRLAVMRCEFDRDAILLSARRTERLMFDAGLSMVKSRFFLLFPSVARAARAIEKRLGRLPIGAQYLTVGTVETDC